MGSFVIRLLRQSLQLPNQCAPSSSKELCFCLGWQRASEGRPGFCINEVCGSGFQESCFKWAWPVSFAPCSSSYPERACEISNMAASLGHEATVGTMAMIRTAEQKAGGSRVPDGNRKPLCHLWAVYCCGLFAGRDGVTLSILMVPPCHPSKAALPWPPYLKPHSRTTPFTSR